MVYIWTEVMVLQIRLAETPNHIIKLYLRADSHCPLEIKKYTQVVGFYADYLFVPD